MENTAINCYAFGGMKIQLDILPAANFTYRLGVGMAVAIWILSWATFCKIGFFKTKQG